MCATGDVMMMAVMVSLLVVFSFPFLMWAHPPIVNALLFICAVVLFRSREHPNCGAKPGFVRAHIESTFHLWLRNLILMALSKIKNVLETVFCNNVYFAKLFLCV